MGRPIEGNIVDVATGRIFPGRITHRGGVITRVEPVSGAFSGYLLPGFLDAHIHIDSSLLCPSRFAEVVVPRGTTAVITDPHEIGNVCGLSGISWMRQDAATVPLRVFFTAPSCVPATAFETSGASIEADDVEALLGEADFVALGEMMNYRGAIEGDPDVTAKIRAAVRAGKPVDGHGPMLTGEGLRKYAGLGISTDHECTSAVEAGEKHALGMRILVREGSVAKNLSALAPFAKDHDFCLVSDDMVAPDLIEGHLDRSLARAVSLGIDPLHAVRSVTLTPASHYRLPLGALETGRLADIVKVKDLSGFSVEEVYIGGALVARQGRPNFTPHPVPDAKTIPVSPRRSDDFSVSAPGATAVVRVIERIRDEIVTGSGIAVLPTPGGRVVPAPEQDILLVCVVNRYHDAPVAIGFVRGFGLKSGAMASSVAHDAHNIIAVGANREEIAEAVNTVIRESGGLCFTAGDSTLLLPLPIAGLMSAEPAEKVRYRLSLLHDRIRAAGCELDQPFMTMSFLSLLTVPRLKIGDRGLFDVDDLRFVDPVISAKP